MNNDSLSNTLPSTAITPTNSCPYCSTGWNFIFHEGICPKIESIEYYPDGTIKEVKFK